MQVVLNDECQVTLPEQIRQELGLSPGDRLDVQVRENGRLELQPLPRKTGKMEDLFGCLKWDGPPMTLEDMERGIEEGAVERYLRAVAKDT